MAAVGDNNFMRYIYRGEEGERVPNEATHIIVGEGVTVVRARAFSRRRNIVEVICHVGVEKIERSAFIGCWSLRRVIMPGVKIVEESAFENCDELTDVEYGKLEMIDEFSFGCCKSLVSINLPYARIVERHAFSRCKALTDVKFGIRLQRLEEAAFFKCPSLERITIPLKDGLITAGDTFQECENLKYVDLVEGELHETITALHLEEWRDEMNEEIDSINQILSSARAGYYNSFVGEDDYGQKARVIRRWIRSVLDKIIHYQAEHQRVLDDAAATLQLVLPRDIVTNNIFPFLELPPHTFQVVVDDEDNHGDSYSDGSSSEGEESEMEEDDSDEEDR